MENVTVAIANDFLTAFARLPRHIQGKVTEFVNKFQNNPKSPGIHYEKINNVDQKLFSVRIDNAYRGIGARQEETGTYILLWIDHHDKAYQWAEKRRCDVNPQTGVFQVFQIQDVKETPDSDQMKKSLFAMAKDDDLLKLGVPELQLNFVRSLTEKEDFYQAQEAIPPDAYENLSWLVEEIPLDEVLELAAEQTSSGIGEDMSASLEVPATLKSFVVVEGQDELKRIMAEPLEKWRVFLHPTQRRIVRKNYSGPARVLGEAGTGKTVVAMHRAKYLASRCENHQRILMTTFTANLAVDIRDNLRKICTVQEMQKIEVINLDAWVAQFIKESGFTARIIYGKEVISLWEEAVLLAGDLDPVFEIPFYEAEWNSVVVPQEAFTLEKYVKASRNGRGTRLDRRKRMEVWKVFEAYQNLMKERQIRDINMAMYEATKLLLSEGKNSRYMSVIVDEGQDFSDNAYCLIRAMAGEEHPNDIFIVGDSHQRIYKNRPILSRCGINVKGRSSILKINYRTTDEIRKSAYALLSGIDFDDLDDGTDIGDKCQSLTHGEKPVVKNFENANDEFEYILGEIQSFRDNGVNLSDICVVARTKKLVGNYIALFTQAGIQSYEIKQNKANDNRFDGLRVATMHRVKGLEFQYVFVAAVNKKIVPHASAIDKTDAVSEKASVTSEKSLLYVAMTRAQKGVYITSYGKKSEFLNNF